MEIALSLAAVAVAVLRDGMRPSLPEEIDEDPPTEYTELMITCWHEDPSLRPSFLVPLLSISIKMQGSNHMIYAPPELTGGYDSPKWNAGGNI